MPPDVRTETAEEYLDDFAQHLIHSLEPIARVKLVTKNTDLLGRYAEAAMRPFIQRFVQPMRVSGGAVLQHPRPATLRQRDVIVWAPFPAPAIFDVEDFALVPQSSAFGLLEMKTSNYSGVTSALEEFVDQAPAEIGNLPARDDDDPRAAVMGVIGVIDGDLSRRLKRLVEQGRVVGIFHRHGDNVDVRSPDIITLVNFLHRIAWRHRVRAFQPYLPQLTPIRSWRERGVTHGR